MSSLVAVCMKVKGNPYPELRSPEEIPISICKFQWFSDGRVDLERPCSALTHRRPQNECLNCHSAECLRILCGKKWLVGAQGAQDFSSHKTMPSGLPVLALMTVVAL